MATIQAIEARTVHQIQSGQVIVDLCSVVKELVENSVDSGATSIDVRFKNQGLDCIQVQDNGSGIAADNYDKVALKHYTSKLSTYEDLNTLRTFGFRGEALSSLCALSKFSVTTCVASEAPKGCRLEFETSGKLAGGSVVAAQKGTTVTVEELFKNLPVRRRELERNIKREWNRVMAVLGQYACIQTGVRFNVSQQPSKGKRVVLFATEGNISTRENIANVFGAKTLAVLIPLSLDLQLEPSSGPGPSQTQSQRQSQQDRAVTEVRVRGQVSRPAHGEGRQTPDRQMFFVNGRPCGLPQFAKVFNDVYKSYNASQSPFILADIQLDSHLYDVNVSPDKRTVMLHDQSRMLDTLRGSLAELFAKQDYVVPQSQLAAAKQTPFKKLTIARQANPDSATAGDVESDVDDAESGQGPNLIRRWMERNSYTRNLGRASAVTAGPAKDGDGDDGRDDGQSKKERRPMSKSGPSAAESQPAECDAEPAERSEAPIPSVTTQSRLTAATHARHLPSPPRFRRGAAEMASISIGAETVTTLIGSAAKRRRIDEPQHSLPSFQGRLSQMMAGSTAPTSASDQGLLVGNGRPEAAQKQHEADQEQQARQDAVDDEASPAHEGEEEVEKEIVEETVEEIDDEENKARQEDEVQRIINAAEQTAKSGSEETEKRTKRFLRGGVKGGQARDATWGLLQRLRVSEPAIRHAAEALAERLNRTVAAKDGSAASTHAFDAPDAEARLSLTISKADFCTMRIVGQFNLGFILAVRAAAGGPDESVTTTTPTTGPTTRTPCPPASRGTDELFIIDQHATDEKYNFERLQATTVLQSQPLARPKPLRLTAVEEEVVRANRAVLEANGFAVSFDDDDDGGGDGGGDGGDGGDGDGDRPVGSRCRLLSLPLSGETTFSLTDLEELIALLSDPSSTSGSSPPPPPCAPCASPSSSFSPFAVAATAAAATAATPSSRAPGGGGGSSSSSTRKVMTTIARPSRVRSMFAMRACRSSVMIGDALSARQMESLVRRMAELDKPWNCPHGRPTMRHLCGLASWDGRCAGDGDGPGWREASSAAAHGVEAEGAEGAEGPVAPTDWAAYLRRMRQAWPAGGLGAGVGGE